MLPRYMSDMKRALARSIDYTYNNEEIADGYLRMSGIVRTEAVMPDGPNGEIEIRLYADGNPLPAKFRLRLVARK